MSDDSNTTQENSTSEFNGFGGISSLDFGRLALRNGSQVHGVTYADLEASLAVSQELHRDFYRRQQYAAPIASPIAGPTVPETIGIGSIYPSFLDTLKQHKDSFSLTDRILEDKQVILQSLADEIDSVEPVKVLMEAINRGFLPDLTDDAALDAVRADMDSDEFDGGGVAFISIPDDDYNKNSPLKDLKAVDLENSEIKLATNKALKVSSIKEAIAELRIKLAEINKTHNKSLAELVENSNDLKVWEQSPDEKDLTEELKAVCNMYDGFFTLIHVDRYDDGRLKNLYFTTKAVELYDIDFGRFLIEVNPTCVFKVYPYVNNIIYNQYGDNTYFHPHIDSYFDPCLGTGGRIVHKAAEKGELAPIMDVAYQVLTYYNAESPYMNIDEYKDLVEHEDYSDERCRLNLDNYGYSSRFKDVIRRINPELIDSKKLELIAEIKKLSQELLDINGDLDGQLVCPRGFFSESSSESKSFLATTFYSYSDLNAGIIFVVCDKNLGSIYKRDARDISRLSRVGSSIISSRYGLGEERYNHLEAYATKDSSKDHFLSLHESSLEGIKKHFETKLEQTKNVALSKEDLCAEIGRLSRNLFLIRDSIDEDTKRRGQIVVPHGFPQHVGNDWDLNSSEEVDRLASLFPSYSCTQQREIFTYIGETNLISHAIENGTYDIRGFLSEINLDDLIDIDEHGDFLIKSPRRYLEAVLTHFKTQLEQANQEREELEELEELEIEDEGEL